MNNKNSEWEFSKADVFWGEIAPCEHVVQIYEDNDAFLEMLAAFVGSGINAGDSVIVIATPVHIIALEDRLKEHGINIAALIAGDQYIPLDAEKTLSQFMVNNWPDETLFMQSISALLKQARGKNRKVRAFGEMVALLWAQGCNGATVQLEHLWNKFCQQHELSLFCAYPKIGFTQDADKSIRHICESHSRLIAASAKPLTEILYKKIEQAV
jgi:MEDS: MEthanogen/methylotroph, DcmR Sensory domain